MTGKHFWRKSHERSDTFSGSLSTRQAKFTIVSFMMNRAVADINSPSVEEKSSVSRVKKSHGLYSFRVEGMTCQKSNTILIMSNYAYPNPIHRLFWIVHSCRWLNRKSWIWTVWSCLAITNISWWIAGSTSCISIVLFSKQKYSKCSSKLQIKCLQSSCRWNWWEFCIFWGTFRAWSPSYFSLYITSMY